MFLWSISCVRYYLKCKLNPIEKDRLAKGIKTGSLAGGKIFYEGMQSALRNATIDEDDVVHFIGSIPLFGRWIIPYGNGDSSLKSIF